MSDSIRNQIADFILLQWVVSLSEYHFLIIRKWTSNLNSWICRVSTKIYTHTKIPFLQKYEGWNETYAVLLWIESLVCNNVMVMNTHNHTVSTIRPVFHCRLNDDISRYPCKSWLKKNKKQKRYIVPGIFAYLEANVDLFAFYRKNDRYYRYNTNITFDFIATVVKAHCNTHLHTFKKCVLKAFKSLCILCLFIHRICSNHFLSTR